MIQIQVLLQNNWSFISFPTAQPPHYLFFHNSCYHHCLGAKGSSTEDQGEASIVQGTLSSPICTFICQDQLLVLAVFLSCPLERGGSQLERGARGYALSPLCGETHGGLERLSAGAERKSEREHTWGGRFFFFFFFPHKSQACFLRGLLGAGTFVVGRTDLLEVHYTGGRERAFS